MPYSTKFRAGELRQLVTIIERTDAKGDAGEVIDAWVPLHTNLRCKVAPIRGKEAEQHMRETGKQEFRFFMWFAPGIKQKHRMIFKDRKFEIKSIINAGEMDIELEILGEEMT